MCERRSSDTPSWEIGVARGRLAWREDKSSNGRETGGVARLITPGMNGSRGKGARWTLAAPAPRHRSSASRAPEPHAGRAPDI